jgi:hypothetical protein
MMNETATTRPTSRPTFVEEALANVADINDLEMKKIAFAAELTRLAYAHKRWERWLGWTASVIGALSVLVGIMVSVESIVGARRAEDITRKREDATRQQALRQPSLDLRREQYLDIVATLGKLAAQGQDQDTLDKAKRRFWELYWADLSLVEDGKIKKAMQDLGTILKDDGPASSRFQQATYRFSLLIRKRIEKVEEDAKKVPVESDPVVKSTTIVPVASNPKVPVDSDPAGSKPQ